MTESVANIVNSSSSYFVYDYFRECPDKLLSETEYVGNVKHGIYRKYNLQGTCILRGGYINNGFHGPTYKYYDSGAVMESYNYENGSLTGEYNTYYPSGKLASFATFLPHNDFFKIVGPRIHGPQIIYHEDGSIKQTCTWHRGEFVGPMYGYYENGRMSEALLRHGNLGVYTKYNREGVLSCYYEIKFIDRQEKYCFAYGHRLDDRSTWTTYSSENKQLYRDYIWISYIPHGYWLDCFTGRFFPTPRIHLYYYNNGREQFEECQDMNLVDYNMVYTMFGRLPDAISMQLFDILNKFCDNMTLLPEPEPESVVVVETVVQEKKKQNPKQRSTETKTPKKKGPTPAEKPKEKKVITKVSNPFYSLDLDSDDE